MVRMVGKVSPSWCYVCHGPAGVDCPDRGKDVRTVKRVEDRLWRREAEDDE